MQEMNVKQFAGELKMQPEHLLEQLKSAGVNKTSINDALSHTDKERLLDFLRQGRNEGGRVTLKRKETSEVRANDASGRSRTIQVEVRKKRVLERPAEAARPAAAPAVAQEASLPKCTSRKPVRRPLPPNRRSSRLTVWAPRPFVPSASRSRKPSLPKPSLLVLPNRSRSRSLSRLNRPSPLPRQLLLPKPHSRLLHLPPAPCRF